MKSDKWSLWNIVERKEELETLFGRKVDLVEKAALKNPFRRYEILSTKQVIYAAQRNVIAHQYEEIRQERLWSVVTSDIPTLIAHLEPLIPPLPPQID